MTEKLIFRILSALISEIQIYIHYNHQSLGLRRISIDNQRSKVQRGAAVQLSAIGRQPWPVGHINLTARTRFYLLI